MTKLSPLVLVTALAVTLPAQQFVADANAQLDEATIPHEVRTGAALDIDRDGDRDVLLIDGSILLNDGTGRFQRHPLLTLGGLLSGATIGREGPSVQVLDPALPPERKSKPRKANIAIVTS